MASERNRLLLLLELNSIDTLMLLIHKRRQERLRRVRRWYVRPPHVPRPRALDCVPAIGRLKDMDEETHFKYFLMSPGTFDKLLKLVLPHIKHQGTHRMPIEAAQRLAVTIRVLASGENQQTVAASFNLGDSTVSRIVSKVCKALWLALQPEYLPCPSTSQWKDIAADFWRLWDFPNCVGSLCAKHVNIKTPPAHASREPKGSLSVLLMATCDARHRFTTLDVAAYGRDGDSQSKLLGQTLNLPPPAALPGTETLIPHLMAADAAFPLHNNIMCPFPGENLCRERQTFNYRLSRTVRACTVLHNYLTVNDEANTPEMRYIPPHFLDSESDGLVQPGEWRNGVADNSNLQPLPPAEMDPERTTSEAVCVRDKLTKFFMEPAGAVPWQGDIVAHLAVAQEPIDFIDF
uniref:DDE Tnp4 domain-containing protein n=1 Tax=Knipowitschia caucasica TaxID=637954 RepID=A0AAV2KSN4_KNICA